MFYEKQNKNGWQNCTWYWLYSDLQKSEREKKKESWTRGVQTEEKKKRRKKKKRTE